MSIDISKLIQLEHNLKNCENDTELFYSIVNQTRELVDYEQALLLTPDLNSKLKTIAISDAVSVDSTSLFVQFINQLANTLYKKYDNLEIQQVNIQKDLDEELRKDLKEYSPSNILWIPLKTVKNSTEVEFYLILFKKEIPNEKEIEILKYLAQSYKFFLFANRKCSFATTLKNLNFNYKNKYFRYAVIAIFFLMLFPVKMSVLAPFEIQAKDPFVVTSPIEGAVDEIKVKPNDYIKKEQLIVKIKDTDLKNSYEIAKRKLDTVKAQLHTLKQASFYDMDKKSQIKELETQVELKEAELNYAKSQLEKTSIYSKDEGIAIINNPNEWTGKPLVTGERIFLIAKENKIEVKIMLAVSDALFLKDKAHVKIFLDNKVFESWDATVNHISYKPELTPENILSYKIIADFNDLKENEDIPQIGLRGTAKIYSDNVTLFFYLFRKPLTTLRQWLAW